MVSGTTSPFGTLWTRRVTGFVISTPDFLPASDELLIFVFVASQPWVTNPSHR